MNRYVAKERRHGELMLWGVYDTQTASWPAYVIGRRVEEFHHSESAAQDEADWLNEVAS